jgi:hypothetical protein
LWRSRSFFSKVILNSADIFYIVILGGHTPTKGRFFTGRAALSHFFSKVPDHMAEIDNNCVLCVSFTENGRLWAGAAHFPLLSIIASYLRQNKIY